MSKWIGKLPERCDICRDRFKDGTFVDAATKSGWGCLCTDCHKERGFGIGVGRGQRYNVETREKVEG
jgi:hypothetical protein